MSSSFEIYEKSAIDFNVKLIDEIVYLPNLAIAIKLECPNALVFYAPILENGNIFVDKVADINLPLFETGLLSGTFAKSLSIPNYRHGKLFLNNLRSDITLDKYYSGDIVIYSKNLYLPNMEWGNIYMYGDGELIAPKHKSGYIYALKAISIHVPSHQKGTIECKKEATVYCDELYKDNVSRNEY
jgi:hypothetical protein